MLEETRCILGNEDRCKQRQRERETDAQQRNSQRTVYKRSESEQPLRRLPLSTGKQFTQSAFVKHGSRLAPQCSQQSNKQRYR